MQYILKPENPLCETVLSASYDSIYSSTVGESFRKLATSRNTFD